MDTSIPWIIALFALVGFVVMVAAWPYGFLERNGDKPKVNHTLCDNVECGQPITHDKVTWSENKEGLSVSYWCPEHAPPGSKALEFEDDLDMVLAVIAEMIRESHANHPVLDEAILICDHYGTKLLPPEFIGYVRASVYWANKRD